jgi:hypothetical protein
MPWDFPQAIVSCAKFGRVYRIKKSTGPFDSPQKIIKRFSKELSFPLTDIINTSFREKRFGKIWKAYNCCPIPKVKPCRESENVRPIAITSIFSKIQES